MDKIKELTDFYMWMLENNYDHNIRLRVEMKAKMYLDTVNVGQKLPIHDVISSFCHHNGTYATITDLSGNEVCCKCRKPLANDL